MAAAKRTILALAIGLCVGSFSIGQTTLPPYEKIRAPKRDETKQFSPRKLHFAYSASSIPLLNKGDAKSLTQVFLDTMAERLESWIVPDVNIIDLSFRSDALDSLRRDNTVFIGLGVDEYLELSKDIPLLPIVVGIQNGSMFVQFGLYARKDLTPNGLADLKGSKLSVRPSGCGRLGVIWLETELLRKGFPLPKKFFFSIKEVGRSTQAILPVFFGQADACVVTAASYDTMVELNPQVGKRLHCICKSEPLMRGLGCIRTDVDQDTKDEIIRVVAGVDKDDVRERQLLTLFGVEELATFRESAMDSVIRLKREHEQLSAAASK